MATKKNKNKNKGKIASKRNFVCKQKRMAKKVLHFLRRRPDMHGIADHIRPLKPTTQNKVNNNNNMCCYMGKKKLVWWRRIQGVGSYIPYVFTNLRNSIQKCLNSYPSCYKVSAAINRQCCCFS